VSESISAAEANRQFSRLLRGVREDGATYIVTAHGRPVAKIVPVDAPESARVTDAVRARARAGLLDRLRGQGAGANRTWKRDDLYEGGD
jgi:prevent-host-death family protein